MKLKLVNAVAAPVNFMMGYIVPRLVMDSIDTPVTIYATWTDFWMILLGTSITLFFVVRVILNLHALIEETKE